MEKGLWRCNAAADQIGFGIQQVHKLKSSHILRVQTQGVEDLGLDACTLMLLVVLHRIQALA